MELADTSAWIISRRVGGEVRERFDRSLLAGTLVTCDMVRLELLHSTRSHEEFRARRRELELIQACPIGEREWRQAITVYAALAERGGLHHRSVKHPDLLIASAAESAGCALLHYDQDYDRISQITGQPTRWIVPRGSV